MLAGQSTYYDLLGVAPRATNDEIRVAFRAAVARYHPDVNSDDDAAQMMAKLNDAWRTLREPLSRALYDASLGLIDGAMSRPGEENLPLLSCERCGATTPLLRYATFLRATPSGSEEISASLCPECRQREAHRSRLISALTGLWRPGGLNNVRAALATDNKGGTLDPETNAILLRHIGLAFAQRELQDDAVTALHGSLEFEPNERIAALAEALARLPKRDASTSAAPRQATTAPQTPGPAAQATAQAADARETAAQAAASRDAATAQAADTASVAAYPDDVRAAQTRPLRIATWALAAAVAVVLAFAGGMRLGKELAVRQPSAAVLAARKHHARAFSLTAFAPRKWPILARVAQFAEKSKDVVPASQADAGSYLFDLPRDPAFSVAYATALNDLPFDDRSAHIWLVTLETTSVPNEFVRTPTAGTYLIGAGCKPNDCAGGRLEVAYNRETHAISANAYYDGRWHAFGSTLADDRAMLALDEALDRLALNVHFPLSRPTEERVERYVAALIP